MKKFLPLAVFAVFATACGGGSAKMLKVVSVDELQKDYRASREIARNRYDGGEFVVTGKAGPHVGENVTKTDDGKFFYYELKGSESGSVKCVAAIGELAKFAELEEGRTISLKGDVLINPDEIDMKPCTIALESK